VLLRRLTAAVLLFACCAAAQPRRIVSTAPSITEMLYALGVGDRVVGVTVYCRYPADAQTKPKVGTFLEPDLERILALKPDLVLVIKNPVQVAEKLRKLGLRAEELNQDSIQDVLQSLAIAGKLVGRDAEAKKLSEGIRAELDAVRRSAAGKPRRKALFLVGRAPGTLQGMVGAGPGTFVDELMALAGAGNMLQGSPIQYPRVSLEQVLAADPDVILDMGDFAHAEGKPMEPVSRLLGLWGQYPRLRAVKAGQVIQVGDEIFIRPGPRMGQAARELRRMLAGDARR
jgi:iron complex transport system substrate-binding protein